MVWLKQSGRCVLVLVVVVVVSQLYVKLTWCGKFRNKFCPDYILLSSYTLYFDRCLSFCNLCCSGIESVGVEYLSCLLPLVYVAHEVNINDSCIKVLITLSCDTHRRLKLASVYPYVQGTCMYHSNHACRQCFILCIYCFSCLLCKSFLKTGPNMGACHLHPSFLLHAHKISYLSV